MTWWCSAQSGAWDWGWDPYPGVWLLVAVLAAGYWWAVASTAAGPRDGPAVSRGRLLRFGLGSAVLWAAADWPLGPLGAGYLASVHMVQYLLFTMVVPPLILSGIPPRALRRLVGPPAIHKVVALLSRPLIAFAVFNVVLLSTHLPGTVNTLAATQVGSFVKDMAWLFAGLVFWWQVLGPLPEFQPLSLPGRIVFLIANVFIPTVPASFLTFADYPIYAVYELSAPVGSLTATEDQQLAGLLMKIVGGFAIFGTASVLFFRWHRMEEAAEPSVGAASGGEGR
jgi:putative membrane protein